MRSLLFFMIVATIFTLGCREVTEEMMVEPEETSLKKAQDAMARVNERRIEAHQKAEEAGDFSVLFTIAEPIFQEELGFGQETWQELLDTWEEAHGERVLGLDHAGKTDEAMAEAQSYLDFLAFYYSKLDAESMSGGEFLFEHMATYDEIVIEYLRFSYEYPDSTEESLLALLKKSIVDGKVSIQYPEE